MAKGEGRKVRRVVGCRPNNKHSLDTGNTNTIEEYVINYSMQRTITIQ